MRRLRACLLAATLGATLGCATTADVDLKILTSNSAQQVWEAGQAAMEDKHFEAARRYFRRIVDGFPQHELAPAARLALGDSHFLEGSEANYILAVASYREFLTFYPSHEKAEYAQFQVAESYYRQRNASDRDQTATQQALDEFHRLLDHYPTATSVDAARDRIMACRQTLADSHYRIGWFYQKTRKACHAAMSRYEEVLRDYPDYAGLDAVLFRFAECLARSPRFEEAPAQLERLIEEFPTSPLLAAATALRDEVASRPPLPPPVEETAPPPSQDPTPEPTP